MLGVAFILGIVGYTLLYKAMKAPDCSFFQVLTDRCGPDSPSVTLEEDTLSGFEKMLTGGGPGPPAMSPGHGGSTKTEEKGGLGGKEPKGRERKPRKQRGQGSSAPAPYTATSGGKLNAKPKKVGRSHITGRALYEWNGVVLTRLAMQSFIKACHQLGDVISVTSSYRTAAQQQSLFNQKGSALVADPGKSMHEHGIAVDVNTGYLGSNPRVVSILTRLGWCRWSASIEPWHFAHRRCA